MAEVLGLAASVIAVVDMTGKVGSASFKLMRLWNEINEVPDMLLRKAERIKDLEEFIDDTESQIAKNQLPEAVYNMARLQKHIAKARCALIDLQEMVDRLQAKTNADQRGFKRRFASTKVLLRKDEWNALDKSLDSALYLFSIAQTQYLVAMSTFCTTFVLEEQPRSTKFPGQALTENDYPFETDITNSTRRRKPNQVHSTVTNIIQIPSSNCLLPTFRFGFGANSSFQLSIRTPTWFTGSVYSILAQRSFQGWQLNLRAYEVVKQFDTELFDYLAADNALGLFRYLDEQKMTLYTRNQGGHSLLWLAVIKRAFTTTRLLLERGLDSCVSDPISATDGFRIPLLFVSIPFMNGRDNSFGPQDLPFLELWAAHGLDDVLDRTETIELLLTYGASFPAFRAFLRRNDFDYKLLPVETRLFHLRVLAESDGYWSPDEISQIIPEAEELTAEIIKLSVDNGCALLHSFALLFSWRLIARPNHPGDKQKLEEKKQWTKLIDSCIRQDSTNLHRLEPVLFHFNGYSEASPFSCIMSIIGNKHYFTYATMRHARRLVKAFGSVLATWIAILSDCDVDLLGYGRQERELHERGSTSYRRRWYTNNFAGTAPVSFNGITYGSRPEQWRLWWTWEYEDYAGEFWDLVESQTFKMPGSWVDEPWSWDDFESEEENRLKIWEREETTPWIWSEYRKIRPPI